MTFTFLQVLIIVASVAAWSAGATCLLTLIALGAHERRVATLMTRQAERNFLNTVKQRSTTPAQTFHPDPIAGEPDVSIRAASRMADLKSTGEQARADEQRREFNATQYKIALTPGTAVTKILEKPDHVSVARHRLPTRSPMVNVTMALKVGGDGAWKVAAVDRVTNTDLLNLREIREMDNQNA